MLVVELPEDELLLEDAVLLKDEPVLEGKLSVDVD
jgi:hypothetical protein